MKRFSFLLLLTLFLVSAVACSEQNTPSTPPEADNTGRNADIAGAPTPFDQSENEADLRLTADIRKAVVADESLSLDARNVKIITSGGVVTLRGPVKSQQEKAAIEAKAKKVVGVSEVHNMLEVEVK